ncbi:MAG: oligosaccharide flippase family protein [Candidatus Omnitrophota bacterium]|jgi:O-antigen/teichoic acid export membrane protein
MKKKLIENSLIYSGLQILQGGIGFLLLPIYTRFLSPDDYGVVSVINSVAVFLGIFYMLGLDGAAYRYYFDLRDRQDELKRFWGTIITLLFVLSSVLTLVFLCFGGFLLRPFIGGIKFYPNMLLGIIGAAVLPLFTVYQSLIQAQHNGKKYGIVRLSNVAILSLLTILFVVFFRLRATGPILATTLTAVLFFTFALWKMRGKFIFGINTKYLKKIFSYSLPIVPHKLTGWAVSLLDRILINRFVSTAAVGIYNIGYLFGSIQGAISYAVNDAFAPWFYEEMKENRTVKVKKFFILAMTLYITLSLWITFFAKEFLWIVAKGDFRESWRVVGLLSFGSFFSGYYCFLVNQLFYTEKGTRYVPVATISAALIGFLLNLVLIRRYGIMGAAITMFFTNVVTTFLVGLFAQRLQPVDWDHLFIFKLLLVNGTACIFSYYISSVVITPFSAVLIIKILVVLVCTFVNLFFCWRKVGGLDILKESLILIRPS